MQRIRTYLVVVLAMWASLPSTRAMAHTWFVERDGSGDYTVVQEAVDVAASGDTIRIGTGRFDEKHYVTSPGWSDSIYVSVRQYELTIIGSGPETIIGQSNPWESNQGQPKGIATGDLWGNTIIRIENLRIENARTGVYASHSSAIQETVEIRNCLFCSNGYSLSLIGNGGAVHIYDCVFEYLADDGTHIVGSNQNEIEIRRCEFLMTHDVYGQTGLGLMSVQGTTVEDCHFYQGAGGISVTYGGPTLFRNCVFEGQQVVALFPSDGSSITVDQCTFRNQTYVVDSSVPDNVFTMMHSKIENVTEGSFYISFFGDVSVNNCDLAKGDRGVIWIADRPGSPSAEPLDFTNNYWGTDNPDSIQAWIRDRNDSEDARYFIDWEPYSDVPLPTEKKTMGGLKAMFRGR